MDEDHLDRLSDRRHVPWAFPTVPCVRYMYHEGFPVNCAFRYCVVSPPWDVLNPSAVRQARAARGEGRYIPPPGLAGFPGGCGVPFDGRVRCMAHDFVVPGRAVGGQEACFW